MATFANLTVASRNRGGHRTLAASPSPSTVVGDITGQRHKHGYPTTERVARWLSQQRTLETEGFVMLDPEDQPGYRPASREPFVIDVDDPPGDRWDVGEPIVIDEPTHGYYLAGQPRNLKRKVSYHGHRDEDSGIPEPSGGALRQDMKAMLAGKYSMELPVRKRARLPAQLQPNPASNPRINTSSRPALSPPGHPFSPTSTSTVTGGASLPSLNPVGSPSFNPAASTSLPGPVTTSADTLVSSPFAALAGLVSSLASSPTLSPPPIPILPPAPATARSQNRRRRGARKLRSVPETGPGAASVPTPRLEPVSEEILDVTNEPPSEEVQIIESIEPQGKCWFFILSAEIRDHIYRHLLVSQKPVHVKQLWTEPARSNARRSPRKRGAAPEKLFEMEADTLIDTRILRVCRQTAFEGTRILYSENKFLYILRDPPRDPLPASSRRYGAASCGGSRRSHRAAVAQSQSYPSSSTNTTGPINFAKYRHLFRNMAIELEPNRTANEYEHLMVNALEALTGAAADTSSSTDPGNDKQLTIPQISLDTLTVTITPVLQPKTHKRRETSVADFFSSDSRALSALRRINTRSIRVHVHVDRPRNEDDDSDEDNDLVDLPDGGDGLDNSHVVRRRDGNKRHLETTIDMRFCPRYMDQAKATHIRNPFYNELLPIDSNVPEFIKVYPDELWQTDQHILAKRSMLGQVAESALADLRERITAACKDPDKAVREGLWEDHEVAERRRRILRAKHQNKFDCDALLFMKKRKKTKKKAAKGKGKEVARDSDDDAEDESNSDGDDLSTNTSDSESDDHDENGGGGDGESSDAEPCFSPTKSLIFSFSKVGDGKYRAYRA